MSMVPVDWQGGGQDAAVRCRWCGWANGLTLVGEDFMCRDLVRCVRWRTAREEDEWVSSLSRLWTL